MDNPHPMVSRSVDRRHGSALYLKRKSADGDGSKLRHRFCEPRGIPHDEHPQRPRSRARGVFVPYVYHEATWSPIGQASDEGWGIIPFIWTTSYRELPPIPSGDGNVATIRAGSGPLWAPASYFVFVHAAGSPDARESMVFQYSGIDASEPTITWISRFALKIAVDEPGDVTLLRSSTGSISISYALGHEVR